MENIGFIHAALAYEAPESIEVVPFRFDCNIFTLLHRKKLSSFVAMRLLYMTLTLFFLSSVGQALALEKQGNKGASVVIIQKCLKQLGYFNSTTTGYYGSITKSAVTKFQKDNKLIADGVVGKTTQRTLQSKCSTSNQKPTPNTTGVLKQGSRNAAVKQLQQDLKDNGYFPANPTGNFGLITKDAVIKFQKANGLTVDGIAGSKTLAAIKNSSTAPSGIGGEKFTLRLDSRSAEVTSLKKRLQQLGYFKGRINDYFGSYTENVVKQFQKDKGLTPDGIVGAKTQQKIDEAIKRLKRKPPSKDIPLRYCAKNNCPTLRAGDKGRYVKYLQTRLRHWGYFTSKPNGNYDSRTVEAVRRFQQDRGMYADGVVGPQTWWEIEKVNLCRKPILQRGDEGECVIKLQKSLSQIPYLTNVNSTGYFDYATWQAVKQFQSRNNLPDNGIVDPPTWEALARASKINNRYVVLIPVTSKNTLKEVRNFVPDAFIVNTKLGEYVQVGEFESREGAENYSQYLRRKGFNAKVFDKEKL